MEIGDRRIKFSAKGVGAKGLHNYQFSIDFYSDVQPDVSVDLTFRLRLVSNDLFL